MKKFLNRGFYSLMVYLVVLTPNIFTAIVGLESFPFTSAPMFGHYVGDETQLYLIQFEGISGDKQINLEPYYDRPESYFIRHFFSKVYGAKGNISAFNGRLTDNPDKFQNRMQTFFSTFSTAIKKQHQLQLQRINLKAIRVDKDRHPIQQAVLLGYYEVADNHYKSMYEAD